MARRRSSTKKRSSHRDGGIGAAAASSVGTSIRAGALLYDRTRDLPKLIRLDPLGYDTTLTTADAAAIVARLKAALRAERQRARAGHWTYDLNRHIALRQAFVAESECLAALRNRR